MTRSLIVLLILVGFLVGCCLTLIFPFLFYFFIALCATIFVVGAFLKRSSHLVLICWFFAGFLLGVLRALWSFPAFTTSDLAYYKDLDRSLKVSGIIAYEVDVRSDRQYLTLESQKLFFEKQSFPVHGKLLIKAPRYPEYVYGESLEVDCFLESPPVFEKFSYADFLAKDDIFVLCSQPEIVVLEKGQGHLFWSFIFTLKGEFTGRINKLFTEPEASIVAGLLLGLRRSIPDSILDHFSQAGLTHILAISGYNITLMITLFGLAFGKFSRKMRFFGILSGILLFVAFTGFSASIIRAAWMGFFTLFAAFVGRKSQGLLILLFSGAVMVFINPRMLVYDISFQLSFGATLGLIIANPFFEKVFSKLPAFLAETLAVTSSAQVFTTPLIVYYFGRFSLIAPLANLLFLPLIPFIMLFSFLALVVSFVFAPFAVFFSSIAWVLTKVLIIGVEVVAGVPFASVELQ
jgi:competence protein ComEC